MCNEKQNCYWCNELRFCIDMAENSDIASCWTCSDCYDIHFINGEKEPCK